MSWAEARHAILILMVGLAVPAQADEEEVTDLEFLEYLGSWEESDEEWLIFDEETETAENEPQQPQEQKDKESAEQNDEA